MKNKCESCGRSKSRIFTAVILLFFEGNKTLSARNGLDKLAIVSRSNNAGGLRAEPPAAGGKRGFGVRASDAEVIFAFLFQKIRIFMHLLV